MWETAFLATTVALDQSLEDAVAALPPSSNARIIEDFALRLRSPSRVVRVQTLTDAVREIMVSMHTGSIG